MMQIFTDVTIREHLMTGAMFGFLFSLAFALNSLLGLQFKVFIIRVVQGTLSGVLATLINFAAFMQFGDVTGIKAIVSTAIWSSISGFAGMIYVQAIFDKLANKAGLDISTARDNIMKFNSTLHSLARVKNKKRKQSTIEEINKSIERTEKMLQKLKEKEKV